MSISFLFFAYPYCLLFYTLKNSFVSFSICYSDSHAFLSLLILLLSLSEGSTVTSSQNDYMTESPCSIVHITKTHCHFHQPDKSTYVVFWCAHALGKVHCMFTRKIKGEINAMVRSVTTNPVSKIFGYLFKDSLLQFGG